MSELQKKSNVNTLIEDESVQKDTMSSAIMSANGNTEHFAIQTAAEPTVVQDTDSAAAPAMSATPAASDSSAVTSPGKSSMIERLDEVESQVKQVSKAVTRYYKEIQGVTSRVQSVVQDLEAFSGVADISGPDAGPKIITAWAKIVEALFMVLCVHTKGQNQADLVGSASILITLQNKRKAILSTAEQCIEKASDFLSTTKAASDGDNQGNEKSFEEFSQKLSCIEETVRESLAILQANVSRASSLDAFDAVSNMNLQINSNAGLQMYIALLKMLTEVEGEGEEMELQDNEQENDIEVKSIIEYCHPFAQIILNQLTIVIQCTKGNVEIHEDLVNMGKKFLDEAADSSSSAIDMQSQRVFILSTVIANGPIGRLIKLIYHLGKVTEENAEEASEAACGISSITSEKLSIAEKLMASFSDDLQRFQQHAEAVRSKLNGNSDQVSAEGATDVLSLPPLSRMSTSTSTLMPLPETTVINAKEQSQPILSFNSASTNSNGTSGTSLKLGVRAIGDFYNSLYMKAQGLRSLSKSHKNKFECTKVALRSLKGFFSSYSRDSNVIKKCLQHIGKAAFTNVLLECQTHTIAVQESCDSINVLVPLLLEYTKELKRRATVQKAMAEARKASEAAFEAWEKAERLTQLKNLRKIVPVADEEKKFLPDIVTEELSSIDSTASDQLNEPSDSQKVSTLAIADSLKLLLGPKSNELKSLVIKGVPSKPEFAKSTAKRLTKAKASVSLPTPRSNNSMNEMQQQVDCENASRESESNISSMERYSDDPFITERRSYPLNQHEVKRGSGSEFDERLLVANQGNVHLVQQLSQQLLEQQQQYNFLFSQLQSLRQLQQQQQQQQQQLHQHQVSQQFGTQKGGMPQMASPQQVTINESMIKPNSSALPPQYPQYQQYPQSISRSSSHASGMTVTESPQRASPSVVTTVMTNSGRTSSIPAHAIPMTPNQVPNSPQESLYPSNMLSSNIMAASAPQQALSPHIQLVSAGGFSPVVNGNTGLPPMSPKCVVGTTALSILQRNPINQSPNFPQYQQLTSHQYQQHQYQQQQQQQQHQQQQQQQQYFLPLAQSNSNQFQNIVNTQPGRSMQPQSPFLSPTLGPNQAPILTNSVDSNERERTLSNPTPLCPSLLSNYQNQYQLMNI